MTRKLGGPLNGKFFMGFLIAVGILLRFKHYLENHSLWKERIYHPITATQWPQHSRTKRTWILISHSEPELEPFILSALDHSGHRIDEYKAKGASLYLYDLSKHQRTSVIALVIKNFLSFVNSGISNMSLKGRFLDEFITSLFVYRYFLLN